PVAVEVVAFRNNSGMRQFLPWYKGKPTDAVGLYLGGEARNFVLVDLSSEGRWPTTYYEFAHMLLDANYPPAQPWFDEGFAGYFSTVRVSNKEVRIGAAPEGLQDILKQNKLMPVTDLFSVDGRILQETGDYRILFTSQSWLLVHYLIASKKLSQAGEYFDLVQNQSVPIPEAIRRAFGMEPAEFDRQLESYRRGGQGKQVAFEAPAGVDSGGYQPSTLDNAAVKTIMAEVHLNSPDYKDQAIKEFEEVLAVKPDHAPAHRGLGYAWLRRNKTEKAGEHFRRAAELSPNDPRALYFSALFRSMSGTGDSDSAWAMKDQLTKAIAIDPESADMHSLLAAAHMMTQDVESAIASIKTAIRLSPRNPAYQITLGQYYISGQRWDEAEALFKRLQRRNEPQLAALAADFLNRLTKQRANPPTLMVRQVRPPDTSAYESPKWKRKKDSAAAAQPASAGSGTEDSAATGSAT
ncbi:MAG: tetratricopeptide repeat protein, partial [Terriglobales bacterium]